MPTLLTEDEAYLAAETARDHDRAKARGVRLAALTDAVLAHLQSRGITLDPSAVRQGLFHALADELYGNAAIDIPSGLERG